MLLLDHQLHCKLMLLLPFRKHTGRANFRHSDDGRHSIRPSHHDERQHSLSKHQQPLFKVTTFITGWGIRYSLNCSLGYARTDLLGGGSSCCVCVYIIPDGRLSFATHSSTDSPFEIPKCSCARTCASPLFNGLISNQISQSFST